VSAEKAREAGGEASWQARDWIWVLVVVAIVFAGRFTPYKPVSNFFGGFSWLTEQALHLTHDLFESYGYLTVFLAPMLENTLFIGALIPGTIVMLVAGISASDGLVSIWIAIPLAVAGAIIGDTISYWMGRFGAGRLGPETRLVKFADQMREPLLNNSVWLVLSYHFAGYSRLIGPAAAGFLHMPFPRWMLLDYIGVSIWVCVFMIAGYFLGLAGLTLDDSDGSVRVFEIILFGFFALAIFGIMRNASKRRQAREEIEERDDASEASREP
jgi:membrane protein DedA with SNARE-associated domain